jgi:DNA helicase-2/ATP-dependent DNA helicase PcrA
MTEMFKYATILADESDKKILGKLSCKESFVVEAGAGAGKTYSLIKVVDWLLKNEKKSFKSRNQKVACITYTNAAVEVIKKRLPENCFIIPSTIHSFLWKSINMYQKYLVEFSNDLFKNYIEDKGKNFFNVTYTLGIRDIKDNTFYLYHDDVLKLFCKFMEIEKFRKIFCSNYPIVLIDEYQDLNKLVYESFINNFISLKTGPQMIFFGDTWQSIYNTGYNKELKNLIPVEFKPVNFRSDLKIVDVLNKIRPLHRQVPAHDYNGQVLVITNNDFPINQRIKKGPSKGDLPVEEFQRREQILNDYLKKLKGWNLSQTKELMLTHNLISQSNSFSELYKLIKTDGLKDKKNIIFAFCSDIIEPIYEALSNKQYERLFDILKSIPIISTKESKKKWKVLLEKLDKNRKKQVIDVLKVIYESEIIPIPEEIINIITKYEKNIEIINENDKDLLNLNYIEIIEATKYVNNQTTYRTEHGVKGEEFESVIVVVGRGWNNYKYDMYLPLECKKGDDNYNSYVRNRNLFYVSCSRAKKNLLLFVTVKVDEAFNQYLEKVFDAKCIFPFADIDTE